MDLSIIVILAAGVAIGAAVGWLVTRPEHARLRSELEKERAVHAERVSASQQAHQQAEASLREAFQALSADALKTNNEAFLHLAESRLREARTEATSDIDERKKATIVRNGKPATLRYERIKDLSAEWAKQLVPSE